MRPKARCLRLLRNLPAPPKPTGLFMSMVSTMRLLLVSPLQLRHPHVNLGQDERMTPEYFIPSLPFSLALFLSPCSPTRSAYQPHMAQVVRTCLEFETSRMRQGGNELGVKGGEIQATKQTAVLSSLPCLRFCFSLSIMSHARGVGRKGGICRSSLPSLVLHQCSGSWVPLQV